MRRISGHRGAIAACAALLLGCGYFASGDAPCDLSYYPVRSGASWQYQASLDPGVGTRTKTETAADVRVGDFRLVVSDGVTRTFPWLCTTAGLNPTDVSGSLTLEGRSGWSETAHTMSDLQGALLPRRVSAGDGWSFGYRLQGSGTLEGAAVTYVETVAENLRAVATETVTVPAGSYAALRIDAELQVTTDLANGGLVQRTNVHLTGSSWWAPGVGRVRSSDLRLSNGQGQQRIEELVSATLP